MKRIYLLTICLLFIDFSLFGQKPAIESNDIGKWVSVGGAKISNDGKYMTYVVNNEPLGNRTLVIRSVIHNWEKKLTGIGDVSFTADSKTALFSTGKDSLCFLSLGTESSAYIPNVQDFRLFTKKGKEGLIYRKSTARNELVVRNLSTGKETIYPDVSEYQLSENVNVLVLKRELKKDSAMVQSLSWVNLNRGTESIFWEGTKAGNIVLDKDNSQVAFVTENTTNNKNEKIFWHFRVGSKKAIRLWDNSSIGVDKGLHLEGIKNFSQDGSRIFFTMKEEDFPKSDPETVKVDVWSYTDPKLQSQQLDDLKPSIWGTAGPRSYIAVINLENSRIVRLEKEEETLSFFQGTFDDFGFITKRMGDYSEGFWNRTSRPSYALVNTRTEERKTLDMEFADFQLCVSPGGKYLILRDNNYIDLFSYELATGITRNITALLPVPIGDAGIDNPAYKNARELTLAIWLENDKALLVYDKYDLWEIDPLGKKPPINRTSGYGRKHGITFRLTGDRTIPIVAGQKLLLTAFNNRDKSDGFYSLVFGKQADPQLLSAGPYHYSPFIKAKYADTYVVQRERAAASPNYFVTGDFKSFTPLSSVYPEKKYNWLSSELVNFKTLDGKSEQGVLFKPENFDSTKKYPIIFYYYERKSERLNVYDPPGYAPGWINIPWFVSRGYLVFTPDIHYTIGEPGESAFNSIVGAARHMKTFPFVDSTKMGIQGHSFGGYETNYLVTHTDLFAAAMSAAGPSDFISGYNGLNGPGASAQFFYEVHQIRIGATLWKRPDLYIKNSPIFRADKVTTPLLMMHNKEDAAVPFAQGVELFTALRRLGKKAWMLQYDGERHSLRGGGKAEKDYTIRITQFFDHYLKGAPAPAWMLQGIPAKMKGIDDGLRLSDEVDANGKPVTPGPGLLITEQKEAN